MAQQQRYIYPPVTVEGLQALYNNPSIDSGFSTIQTEILSKELLYDRAITDELKLPHDLNDLKIVPNELAVSTSMYTTSDKLHANFLYLNTRANLASNALPGNYTGHFSCDGTGKTVFIQNQLDNPASVPPTKFEGIDRFDSTAPSLSDINGTTRLNDTITGVVIRDNSIIDSERLDTAGENYHYGFFASPTTVTVGKMSSTPEHETVVLDEDTNEHVASLGWIILHEFTDIQDIPDGKNTLKFTNISKIKTDNAKNLYILDSGLPDRAGVTGVSDSSQRGMIYKYDISGYLNMDNDQVITKNKRLLTGTIGDVNKITNESDIVHPVAFTVNESNDIIVYDNADYTFKVFDEKSNFLYKKSKRNTFFRGAKGERKKYLGVSDIHYDRTNNQLYVLTPPGYLYIFDQQFNLLNTVALSKGTSNQSTNLGPGDTGNDHFKAGYPGHMEKEQFIQLEFSANESNVYYILTTNRVVKRFKSQQNYDVGVYNLLDNRIGTLASSISNRATAYRALPRFLSVFQDANVETKLMTDVNGDIEYVVDVERSYTYDQIYMFCDFYDIGQSTKAGGVELGYGTILSFEERINRRSCLTFSDYDIYDVDGTKSINHREYNSDMSYNKLMYKILCNHIKMIEMLQYRLSASYISTGDLIFDKRIYMTETEHRGLLIDVDQDMFIGINEYFTSGVINRCIEQIYNLQRQILNVLQTVKTNQWPLDADNIPLEPYLYTGGGQFVDIDDRDYIGYYYVRESTGGDVYVTGRNAEDGSTRDDGSPETDRYLTTVS